MFWFSRFLPEISPQLLQLPASGSSLSAHDTPLHDPADAVPIEEAVMARRLKTLRLRHLRNQQRDNMLTYSAAV